LFKNAYHLVFSKIKLAYTQEVFWRFYIGFVITTRLVNGWIFFEQTEWDKTLFRWLVKQKLIVEKHLQFLVYILCVICAYVFSDLVSSTVFLILVSSTVFRTISKISSIKGFLFYLQNANYWGKFPTSIFNFFLYFWKSASIMTSQVSFMYLHKTHYLYLF